MDSSQIPADSFDKGRIIKAIGKRIAAIDKKCAEIKSNFVKFYTHPKTFLFFWKVEKTEAEANAAFELYLQNPISIFDCSASHEEVKDIWQILKYEHIKKSLREYKTFLEKLDSNWCTIPSDLKKLVDYL